MPSEKTNNLEFSQYLKSDKTLFIIYTDLNSLIEIIWKIMYDNQEETFHEVFQYLQYHHLEIQKIKLGLHEKVLWNLNGVWNGDIDFFKKLKWLTNELQELYENVKICYICKGMFEDEYIKIKTIVKLAIVTTM